MMVVKWRMFRYWLLLASIAVCCLSTTSAWAKEKLLDQTCFVSGNTEAYWHYNEAKVGIGGVVTDTNWATVSSDTTETHANFATFDIRGWEEFTAAIGFQDDRHWEKEESAVIEVGGKQVWEQKISFGAKPFNVDIPISGAKSLTIRYTTRNLIIADPKLLKGNFAPSMLADQLVSILIDTLKAATDAKDQPIIDLISKRLDAIGVVVDIKPEATVWHLK